MKPQLQATSVKHRNLSFLAGNNHPLAGYTPVAAFDPGMPVHSGKRVTFSFSIPSPACVL
ncbi:MAG: hypothetical protein WBO19_17105 [Terriglobia bacterium]